MQDRASAAVDAWEVEDGSVFFRGHHTGYAGWKVVREMRCGLRYGRLEVLDIVEQLGAEPAGVEFCGRLHLAAGVEAVETGAGEFLLRAGGLTWTVRFAAGLRASRCEGKVSPAYGVLASASILEYRFAPAEARSASFSIERAGLQ
jgi:hypothetical protein